MEVNVPTAPMEAIATMAAANTPNSGEVAWNQFEASFSRRRWGPIAGAWVDFVPAERGAAAQSRNISDYIYDEEIFSAVPPKSQFSELRSPRSEIPRVVLSEAIRWAHKAIHVFGASEAHVEKGLPTWALSSAYQAGFFAARSIMAFLGVAIGEFEKRSITVDLCKDIQRLRDTQITSRGGPFSEDIPFRSVGDLFGHNRIWELFQKLLKVTDCNVWPPEWKNYLINLNMADFTRQRHGLHYNLAFWVENDLLEFTFPEDFRNLTPQGTGTGMFESKSNNYTLAVSFLLLKMALMLFADVTRSTKRMAGHQIVMEKLICQERHPLFSDTLKLSFASAGTIR